MNGILNSEPDPIKCESFFVHGEGPKLRGKPPDGFAPCNAADALRPDSVRGSASGLV